MIAAAGMVAPALAGADQDAAIRAGRGLADLHIDAVMMKGDFAGDGDYVECKEAFT